MAEERHTIQLTEEERNQRAREAASWMREFRSVEDRSKETAREFREELAELRTKADKAARAAHDGVEERMVEVRHEADNEAFKVHTYRADTGERVNSRPMSDDEIRIARQQVLDLRPAAKVSPLRGNTRGGQP